MSRPSRRTSNDQPAEVDQSRITAGELSELEAKAEAACCASQ